MTTWYRSRAPLRLGLAGGGTDVSPYSDQFGGCVLNATIDLFSYCSLSSRDDNQVHFAATDLNKSFIGSATPSHSSDNGLPLHSTVYNVIVHKFNKGISLPCNMVTYSDAPAGSGLGSSSTLVVAMLGAFKEWLQLPLEEYEIAHLAFEIERITLSLAGGKQDQYAAAFGGFNFMEFLPEGEVVVSPLKIDQPIINELQLSLVLYYTGASRNSSQIIAQQMNNVKTGVLASVEAMHEIKQNAVAMKEYLLQGHLKAFSKGLNSSWQSKKAMASVISNNQIEAVFEVAMKAGALAGKVSGAGGGGYIMFMVDPSSRMKVIRALEQLDGTVQHFNFTSTGMETWRAKSLVDLPPII